MQPLPTMYMWAGSTPSLVPQRKPCQRVLAVFQLFQLITIRNSVQAVEIAPRECALNHAEPVGGRAIVLNRSEELRSEVQLSTICVVDERYNCDIDTNLLPKHSSCR